MLIYLFMGLFAVAIAVLDQLSKVWTVANIPLQTQIPAVPGLFHLTNVQNTGAAFSSFQGMRWVFVALFAALTVLLIWDMVKKKLPLTPLERWCVAAIYGGGLGNIIDRIRLGYVVDMIQVEFMNFPVFNVADSFITCGCLVLFVSMVVSGRKEKTP